MGKLADSLTFDRRFLHVFLLELLILALVSAGVMSWSAAADTVADDVQAFRENLEQLGGLGALYQDQTTDEMAKEVMQKLFIYTALLIIFIIGIWTLIKNRIYNLILKKSWSWQTYWRFALVTVVWAIITFIVFMMIQNAVFLTLEANMRGVLAQVILLTVIVIEYLVLFWLTLWLFTPLVNEGSMKAGIKGLWEGIKKFDKFLLPMVIAMAVLVALNLVMYLLARMMPVIFMTAFTLVLIAYLTWVRLYYLDVMENLPARKAFKKKNDIREHKSRRVHYEPHQTEHKSHRGKRAAKKR